MIASVAFICLFSISSNVNSHNGFILPNEIFPLPSKAFDSLWISNSLPTFHGSVSMVNFDDTRGKKTKERSFFPSLDKEENSNEDYEVSFHQPEKKRRLLPKQVQFLEKSFEVENKLEPERKIQLAKEIGLQPRQVAIWFENRRARYKSKQLEKDYDVLKASFVNLKDEHDSLFKENENLRNEVHLLKEKLFNRVNGEQNSEQKEPISPLNTEDQNSAINMQNLTMMVCKQEDASSAKSDIFYSDSHVMLTRIILLFWSLLILHMYLKQKHRIFLKKMRAYAGVCCAHYASQSLKMTHQ